MYKWSISIFYHLNNTQNICILKLVTQFHIKLAKNLCQTFSLNAFWKSQMCTQTLTPPENHAKMFENQKLNAIILILLSPNLYFLRYRPICPSMSQFSAPTILNFLTWRTQKFKLYIFFPHTLSLTQIEPKKAWKILIWCSSWPWNRCTHTFGRHCLLVICFGQPVWVTQKLSSLKQCNLLESPQNSCSIHPFGGLSNDVRGPPHGTKIGFFF